MRQKAINLDQAKMKSLFPALADDENTTSYMARVDVFAPDVDVIVDQQAITLSQKNWRLNGLLSGHLVVNPGDVLVCQILGDDAPATDRVPTGVGLAVVRDGDQGYGWLKNKCPRHGFANVDDDELLGAETWDESSPVWQLIDFLTEGLTDLVDDVLAGSDRIAIPRIGLRSIERTGTTREAIEKFARVRAAIGLGGETMIDALLERKRDAGEIKSYDWVSASNATAPVDFRACDATRTIGIEVKTTKGAHEKSFPISVAELREAKAAPPYEVWRVSAFAVKDDELVGLVRRTDPATLVEATLRWLDTSPEGVGVSSVNFAPSALAWSDVETATCPVSRVPNENWTREMDLEAS